MKSTKMFLFLATAATIGLCLYSTNMLAGMISNVVMPDASTQVPSWPSDVQDSSDERVAELAAGLQHIASQCTDANEPVGSQMSEFKELIEALTVAQMRHVFESTNSNGDSAKKIADDLFEKTHCEPCKSLSDQFEEGHKVAIFLMDKHNAGGLRISEIIDNQELQDALSEFRRSAQ